MRRVIYLMILFLISQSLLGQETGRRNTRYGFEIDVKPRLYCDPYVKYSEPDGQPMLCIRLKVQYDMLQFTKVDHDYQTSYDVSVIIRENETAAPAFSTIWQESIKESDFEKTNSSRIFHNDDKVFNLPLPEGTYLFYLEFTDQTTRRILVSKSKLAVPNLKKDPIAVSEIKLLSTRDSLSAEINIGAQVSSIEFDQPVLANFYIGQNNPDTLLIVSQLVEQPGAEETIIKTQTYHVAPKQGISVFRELIDKNILKEGRQLLRYKIGSGQRSIQLQKEFLVIWYEKPIYLYEFGLALRPLEAIIPAAERDSMEDLSAQNKKKWFDDYWRSKDPTPGTPMNEIQYEFYHRVDMANSRYSLRFSEGWQTDRGYTLLAQGIPDSVETNRYSTRGKPYEIWYYQALKKKFTFVDVDRDENYKLSAIEDFEEKKHE
jgi:GWxTD domain-containing protein